MADLIRDIRSAVAETEMDSNYRTSISYNRKYCEVAGRLDKNKGQLNFEEGRLAEQFMEIGKKLDPPYVKKPRQEPELTSSQVS